MRILIVDDEAHILKDLAQELALEKHTVFTASSVGRAGQFISTEQLDWAIIDLKLDFTSGYGGIDICAQLKHEQPDTKIIILSGQIPENFQQQLTEEAKHSESVKELLDEGNWHYIYVYKGDHRMNYIDAVLDTMGIESEVSNWYGTYHALLIAVQNYQDRRIADLNYPISDAIKLKHVLTKEYVFEEPNVNLLVDPSREVILERLYRLSKILSSEDSLLIFYAGHGDWSDDREQGYWLPVNAASDMPANWMSNSDIRDFIRGIKTQHTLLISDACFSGGIFKRRNRLPVANTIREKYKKRSRCAITSSDETRPVPDRSVFLDYLLANLRSNNKGYLYSQRLYTDICDSMIDGNLPVQNPIYGEIDRTGHEIGGDFIFVKK